MVEKDMQMLFGKYLRKNPPLTSEVYELKICKQKRLYFREIKEHQREALLKTETGYFYHKIADMPMFTGMKNLKPIKRPFDCFVLVKTKAFVVVWFYKPGTKKIFIKMSIKAFLELEKSTTMKSFTEEMALERGEAIFIDN